MGFAIDNGQLTIDNWRELTVDSGQLTVIRATDGTTPVMSFRPSPVRTDIALLLPTIFPMAMSAFPFQKP